MKTLSIESFAVKPHFETAIELALKSKNEGNTVCFAFYNFFYDLQRLPGHLKLGFFKNIQWLKKDNERVNEILDKLKNQNIEVKKIKPFNFLFFLKALKFAFFHPFSIEKIKVYQFDGMNLGVGAASTYISRCNLETPKITFSSLTIKKLLFEAAISYQYTLKLINTFSPDLVCTFNGRYAIENGITQACIKKNVKIQLHERGSTFEKYDVFNFPLHSYNNHEEKIKNHWNLTSVESNIPIAIDFFEKKRRGDDINWLSFNRFYAKDSNLPQTDKIKVVYFSSSDDELASIINLESQPLFKKQRECIKYLIDYFSNKEEYLFIVRNHPNIASKHPEDKLFWDSLTGENLVLYQSTSKINSFELIDYSDIVITYSSTIGIESTYWKKPAILMGLAIYRFLDCTYNPKSIDEFELLLTQKLNPKKQELCYPFGYFYNTFGKSYQYYSPKSFFDGDLLF